MSGTWRGACLPLPQAKTGDRRLSRLLCAEHELLLALSHTLSKLLGHKLADLSSPGV